MIIGILFIIKGAFNILKGINYFIFKDNFKMIPMELTSVYKSPVSTHEITYIYCYHDERLHIVYEDEEYVTSYMILGIFLFLFGLRIIFLYI